ncbi:hypothetical protein H257_14880 [Aphanomyces astaci]|uniref:Uncharacterized protein n=1 Tax=Aphanomyces astaci TaxID=112090 RepID=W4FSA6_APHAT|nr:hypothetical protein H257_14880 [Aphanomyces astaci]ETV69518.1 hypothetical protein H257_14880 [Aphanomyces astaci]|eukprot:XP_009841091.1 hypothetical protein H257_14880 [Aphanomyces astaci]
MNTINTTSPASGQSKYNLFPLFSGCFRPPTRAWQNELPHKRPPTLMDIDTDNSIPMCPMVKTAAPMPNPPAALYNLFTGLNNAYMKSPVTIQSKPHLFTTRH